MKMRILSSILAVVLLLAHPGVVLAWDLSSASYDSVNFSVTNQAINPLGMTFKGDGTELYIASHSNDRIFQYSLSTAWDVSTASYSSVNYYVGSQSADVMDVEFKSDGTKMYLVDSLDRTIYQYSLSSAWDVSTASYDSVSQYIGALENSPRGIAFKTDGTKMYIAGDSGDEVNEFALSSAWDLSSASASSVFDLSDEDSSPMDVEFKTDGSKMYIMGYSNDRVFQYSLSTAWDITSASYDSVSAYVGSQEVVPWDVHIGSNGSKMYVVGNGYDRVFQYTLTADTTAPTVSYLSPTDDATGVAADAVFEIAFSEAVATSSGNIVLYKASDDSTVETIDITSSKVTASSSSALLINPSTTLESETAYYFFIDETAVDDNEGNSYAGITASTTWSFTAADTVSPTVSSVAASPSASGATITWSSNEDTSSLVNFGPSTAYGSSTAETNTSPRVTSHSVTLASLSSCTLYHYQARSADGGSNIATSSDGTFYTTGCNGSSTVQSATSSAITTASGGSLTEGDITLTIPTSYTATSSSATFQINSLDGATFHSNVSPPSGYVTAGTDTFSLTALTDATTTLPTFSAALTVTMSYEESDISSVDESSLWIYRYDGSDWYALDNCVVDTGANTVTCETNAFSDFSLFGQEVSSSSSSSAVGNGPLFLGSAADLPDYEAPRAQIMLPDGTRQYLDEETTPQESEEASSSTPQVKQEVTPSPTPEEAPTAEESEAKEVHHFENNLRAQMENAAVKKLQEFLNTHGFVLRAEGAGSPGEETEYFGPLTYNALIRFQEAHTAEVLAPWGLTEGTGIFATKTRALANRMLEE